MQYNTGNSEFFLWKKAKQLNTGLCGKLLDGILGTLENWRKTWSCQNECVAFPSVICMICVWCTLSIIDYRSSLYVLCFTFVRNATAPCCMLRHREPSCPARDVMIIWYIFTFIGNKRVVTRTGAVWNLPARLSMQRESCKFDHRTK